MSDLISRADAINAVKIGALSSATIYGRTDKGSTALYETVRAIKALPSAKETAEWVWNEDAIDWGMGAWVCSKCKNRPQTFWETSKKIYPLKWVGSQYCGCCGAKMQKGEASEIN